MPLSVSVEKCCTPLVKEISSVLQIYKSFGLGSSYAKVMKFGLLLEYSEYPAGNRDFPDIPSHLLEDIYQVGTVRTTPTFDVVE